MARVQESNIHIPLRSALHCRSYLQVTVEAFLQVLTGVSVSSRLSRTSATAAHSVLALPHRRSLTRWQSIQPSNASNVFVYLTGHGGDGFLKFQDSQELTARVGGAARIRGNDQGFFFSLSLSRRKSAYTCAQESRCLRIP